MATVVENFDDTTYTISFGAPWTRVTNSVHAGAGSWSSGAMSTIAFRETACTIPAGAKTVQFWYRLQTTGPMTLGAELDGVQAAEYAATGTVWAQSAVISIGAQTTFSITTGNNSSTITTTGWIDDVVFTIPDAPTGFMGWGVPI